MYFQANEKAIEMYKEQNRIFVKIEGLNNNNAI